jgi:hypothetical protein
MDNSLIQANASRESSGNAGSIEVRAGRITLTGGAEIDSGTRGPGHGGEGTIIATDAISIAGHDQAGFPSGLVSNNPSCSL